MKRRIDLICAVYMALILCLAGVLLFVVYQQEQVIEKQRGYITVLQKQGLEIGDGFTIDREIWVEYVQLPPEIVYVEKPIDRLVERVVIEEREREVEVIVYRNIYARNWESVEQFEQWYEGLDFRVIAPSSVYTVDCDDYAEELQYKALEQGYPVSMAVAKNRLYAGVKVTKIDGLHAGNLILIGNTYYWVEPQPEEFYIKRLFDRD